MQPSSEPTHPAHQGLNRPRRVVVSSAKLQGDPQMGLLNSLSTGPLSLFLVCWVPHRIADDAAIGVILLHQLAGRIPSLAVEVAVRAQDRHLAAERVVCDLGGRAGDGHLSKDRTVNYTTKTRCGGSKENIFIGLPPAHKFTPVIPDNTHSITQL